MITPRQALESKGALTPDTIAARVTTNGATVVKDLMTPIPEGAEVAPIRANDPAALPIIRHSSAHVMADAVQRLFPGTKVAFGPATEDPPGFYYDYQKPGGAFTEDDLRAIEKKMAEIVAEGAPFRREVVSVAEARKLLQGMNETFKLEHLERLAANNEEISLYRHGKAGEEWVDLCEGPHVPSAKFLKAFQLTKTSGAYWRGIEGNPMLQRIYGTAFADEKALRTYLRQMEEAEKRDHRKVGKELELIGFHPWAPASPFFLPRGAKIYAALVDYVRAQYRREGYEEVVTPQIFDKQLFLTSGHLPNYAENMYFAMTREDFEGIAKHVPGELADNMSKQQRIEAVEAEARFGIKPMNCPSHCLIFAMEQRSYRQLPLRMADFGRLHRYERSGVTQGMTRVRTFAQDDAHIFCTDEQVQSEIEKLVDLVYRVYLDFGFTEVKVVIATRPEKRMGTDEMWDRAERALIEGVKARNLAYEIAEGEGAFYGPKIEFHLKDAIGRPWQLGTMQYDPNMPQSFDLTYVAQDNTRPRPVMLHRAILGSIERFFGLLIEHVNGAFPTWLAPEQIALLSVSEKSEAWTLEAADILRKQGVRVTVDTSPDKLGAKVRNARNMRIPYRAVVGEKEAETRSLALTQRDGNQELGALPIEEVVKRILAESIAPSLRT
ncbi:MAG: threonine--tRNA ligase [Sandaracinus sp.]